MAKSPPKNLTYISKEVVDTVKRNFPSDRGIGNVEQEVELSSQHVENRHRAKDDRGAELSMHDNNLVSVSYECGKDVNVRLTLRWFSLDFPGGTVKDDSQCGVCSDHCRDWKQETANGYLDKWWRKRRFAIEMRTSRTQSPN